VRFSLNGQVDEPSVLVNLLTEDHSHPETDSRHCILLEPYGYRWFRVGGLDYLLKRSDD
jgi:maltose alpha-D-glucosyltransferase/alpha-amylase